MYGFNNDKSREGAIPSERLVVVSGQVTFEQFAKESNDLWYIDSPQKHGYNSFVALGVQVTTRAGNVVSLPFPTGLTAFQIGFESLGIALGTDNGEELYFNFFRVSDNLPAGTKDIVLVGLYI